MNPIQKLINLLGLAQRSRNLISGEEQVVIAIQQKKAHVVICATNCSENTKSMLQNKCTFYNVEYVEIGTKEELSQGIGRIRSVLAVTDAGFAKSIRTLVNEANKSYHSRENNV